VIVLTKPETGCRYGMGMFCETDRYIAMEGLLMTKLCKSASATLLMCLFLVGPAEPQSPSTPPRWRDQKFGSEPSGPLSNEEPFQNDAVYEQQQFVRRVNNLMAALVNFSSTYKTGQVIDIKKVNAVRKALREMEKSEWFKLGKAD
jgi:hypothetical protein